MVPESASADDALSQHKDGRETRRDYDLTLDIVFDFAYGVDTDN
jgi:hypothetical protein